MGEELRVFISADLEGISGVVDEEQTSTNGKDYERAREWMTADVNAAIEGAVQAGATYIVVNDSHGGMRNILFDHLHPSAHLLSGGRKPMSMMQGIDSNFNVAFFVGYHARRGTPKAIMDHVYTGRPSDIRINGRSCGETAINAAVAGVFGVPVGLVTGCEALCAEAKDFLGNVEVVPVKRAVGRYAALCFPREMVHEQIRSAAEKACCRIGELKPFAFSRPIVAEIDFHDTAYADAAARVPGMRRVAERTVSFESNDYLEVYNALRLAI